MNTVFPMPQKPLGTYSAMLPANPARARPSARINLPANEHGYTMQTLIIITILVLGAVVAFTIVYALLQDSTENITGGSETFDGLPSSPQNLAVSVLPGSADTTVEVTASWDAPSYTGKYTLEGYAPVLSIIGNPATTQPTSCLHGLDTTDDDFSSSNACVWEDYPVDDTQEYVLDFTIQLSDIGGVNYLLPIILDNPVVPPSEIHLESAANTMLVTWTGQSSHTAYRFRISYGSGSDYLLCISPAADATPNRHSQEIPNLANRGNVIYESPASTWPQPSIAYEIELTAATTSITDQASCEDDANFDAGSPTLLNGSFGRPTTPEFQIETVIVDDKALPHVTVISRPCEAGQIDAGTSFTFHWQNTADPESSQQIEFAKCSKTLPISTLQEQTTHYFIWGVAHSLEQTSLESNRVVWTQAQDPSKAPAPAGLRVQWDISGNDPESPFSRVHYVPDKRQATILWDFPMLGDRELPIEGYLIRHDITESPDDDCQYSIIDDVLLIDPREVAPLVNDPSYALCIRAQATSRGRLGESALAESPIPQVELSYANSAGSAVTLAWQVADPADIIRYEADLNKSRDCEKRSAVWSTVVANELPSGETIYTATLPLTSAAMSNDYYPTEDYVCLSVLHREHGSQLFYASQPLTQRPNLNSGSLSLAAYQGNNLSLSGQLVKPLAQANAEIVAQPFYLCLDVLLPSNDSWRTDYAEIVMPSSGGPQLSSPAAEQLKLYDNDSFVFDQLPYVDSSGNLTDITTTPGETYNFRVWTSGDSECPYPEASDTAYSSVSFTRGNS